MSSTLYTGSNYGVISSGNSYNTTSFASGAIFTGVYENIQNYSLISVSLSGISNPSPSSNPYQPPAPGTLIAYYSDDGTDATILSTVSVIIQDVNATGNGSLNSSAFNPSHTFVPTSKFFKIKYINSIDSTTTPITPIPSNPLTLLNISVIYHTTSNKIQTSNCTQYITDYTDADTQRSIITARTEGTQLPGGNYQNINALNGSLNVRIRDPVGAFGEMLTASLTPFVQFDFTSGIPLDVISISQNDVANTSYTYLESTGKISAIAGTDTNISLKSNIFTKYKPGQGCDNRFTALFPNGYIANCDQYAGVFTPEDSLTFGYFNGTANNEFAIRWQSFGNQQINSFVVTGSATSGGTFTMNFGGTIVNIIMLSGDSIAIVCNKIVTAINAVLNLNTYGYLAEYYSVSNVYTIDIIRNIALTGNITITPSNTLGITLTASTPNPLVSGVTPTTVLIPQSTWNLNNCMDNGSLEANYTKNRGGFILDPTKGNVFKIFFQYLGFGQITFCIEESSSESIVPVHRISYPNSSQKPTLKNPSMNIGIGINNTSLSTVAPIVQTASMASFLQGKFNPSFVYRSYGFTLIGASQNLLGSLTNPFVIFGFQVTNIFSSTNNVNGTLSTNNLINKNNIILSNITTCVNAASNTTSNIHFVLIKNPTSVLNKTGVATTNNNLNYIKDNNALINRIDGISPTSTSTGIYTTGGSYIVDIILPENTNGITDLSNFNIILSPSDTIYICTYGATSAGCDISASLSFNVNM
jgi:hypothetical protein